MFKYRSTDNCFLMMTQSFQPYNMDFISDNYLKMDQLKACTV